MSERKNIDRLFQEKFKEFEVKPSDEVWGAIEAKLNEKKKRRVIPFWWKLSGVAAVFLIGFLVSKSIYYDGNKPEKTVANEADSIPNKAPSTKKLFQKELKDTPGMPEKNAVADQTKVELSNPESDAELNNNNGLKSSNNSVVASSNERKSATGSKEKNIYSPKSSVAERKNLHSRSLKNKSITNNDSSEILESEKGQRQLVQNTTNNSTSEGEKQLVLTDPKAKYNTETLDKTNVDLKNINLDDLKATGNSKVAIQEVGVKANDTASKNSVANNELEELLNEKESKMKKESKRNRWQLNSTVAPIFLGSVSNGSPIDSTLSRNSKSFNTNVGFGIGVSYAVNKKLSVRTGLNKVNMSYDTNDIFFYTGIQAKTLANVRARTSTAMIHVESTVTSTVNVTSETALLPFETAIVQKSTGYLRQEMGYLELPVEMTYNLLDKKFGVKIIGGFSTLFLQDNSITIVSQNRDTLLGDAKNLNDVHFSTNLGFGMRYSFLKSFEFNVEPTVKYQLNTFNANAGNFKPYFFGIYSGISYKF